MITTTEVTDKNISRNIRGDIEKLLKQLSRQCELGNTFASVICGGEFVFDWYKSTCESIFPAVLHWCHHCCHNNIIFHHCCTSVTFHHCHPSVTSHHCHTTSVTFHYCQVSVTFHHCHTSITFHHCHTSVTLHHCHTTKCEECIILTNQFVMVVFEYLIITVRDQFQYSFFIRNMKLIKCFLCDLEDCHSVKL